MLLGDAAFRHQGPPFYRTPCPPEDGPAPPPLGEFGAEMVGDVQMRHRTEPQSRLMQLPIKLQELAGISRAGIGDDKADVEIGSGGGGVSGVKPPRSLHDRRTTSPTLEPAQNHA